MSVTEFILLFLASLVSGMTNAIAGGGTFLTFGALTLAGLPPVIANASCSIIQFPGYVTSTLAYLKDIRKRPGEALLLGGLSVIGSLGGALFLLSLSNPSFRAMVPWLLLAATALFAAGPLLKPKAPPHGRPHSVSGYLAMAAQVVTAFYGGFFGAGMGIMMLAVLGLFYGSDYHRINALKNLLATVIAAVAIAVFVVGGAVAWKQSLVMIPAAALGGWLGVHAARRLPQAWLRGAVVAVGLALSAYYFTVG